MTPEATASELRKTGISVIGDVRWGTHFCSFYEKKQDLLETLVLYFKAGLESKEFCVWVVSQALSVKEVKRALAKAVPDLARHLAEGDLEIHSHDEWYLRDGRWDPQRVLQSWREKLNQTSANGHAGLRASGDAGWIQNGDWMAFREYEEQVNALIAGQRSIILCTYPLTTSSGDQVFDVARIHHVAVARRNGSWEIIETSALKEAKAEIKRLNQELEQKVDERTRELATAVEALKCAEDRIRLVIDTIPTMAWSLRPDGVLDFLNQRWLDYTGLSLEEAIAEPTCTVHPEDLPRVMEKWLAVKDTREPYEDEMRLRRADGEYRWFLVRIAPLLDEQGNLLKRYGTSTDIEDRKRAAGALNAQALRYKTLLATSTDSIYVVDEKGDLQEANAAFLRRRGYNAAEVKDLNVADWDAQWSREQLQERLRELVGSSGVFETRHRCKDGSVFDVEVSATSVRIGGEQLFFAVTREITERKRVEEKLWQSLNLLRAMMEGTTDAMYAKDREGRHLMINTVGARFFGKSPEEVIGLDDNQIFSGETLARIIERDRAIMKTGETRTDENITTTPAGLSRVHLTTKGPLRDSAGTIIGLFGVSRDITERKREEEKLRESETRFRLLVQSSNIGLWDWNLVTNEVFFSPEWKSQLGYADDEVPDRYEEWESRLHPEDREASLCAVQDFREGRLQDYDVEFRLRHKDGSWRSILTRADLIRGAAGQPVRMLGCHIDITERKKAEQALRESEQQMRLFMEATADCLWNWDLITGNVVRSVGFNRAFGYSEQEVDSGVTWWEERLHSDDRGDVLSTFQDTIAGGGDACSYEYRFRRKDGTYAVIHDHAYIVRDAKAKPLRALGAMIDITERKEAEEALHKANRQLRLLSRRLFGVQEAERRHLARELHDEIGQALTAAKINLQSVTGNRGSANFARLQETTAILDRLLGQVRQISLDLRPSTLDDLGLVPALRSLLDQQGRRASVAVRFSEENVPENLSPEIRTTCFRIAQEAITNAVRHANATRIDVDLGCENGNLRLQVRDNGRGFDADSAQAQTTGLGLIGIKERAALVDAQAKIVSSPNNGTTVEVSLPLTFPSEKEGLEIGK